MIIRNAKYIVSNSKGLRIYCKQSLSLLKVVKESICKFIEITDTTIFFTNDQGLFTYKIETQIEENIVKITCGQKITAIFIKDSFLYVGYDSGILETYAFNEHLFRLQKTYKHMVPITGIKSDNLIIYVTDLRDRITIYPENSCFDFQQPKIFFNQYLYALSENKIYTNTKDAFGFLFDLKESADTLLFSPKGGILFARGSKGTRCYGSFGEELGRFFVDDFTVISKDGMCFIVEELNGTLKLHETFIKDIDAPELQFTKVNIKEKVIKAEEYDQKYAYVDVGSKKYITRTAKQPKVRSIKDDSEEQENAQNRKKRSQAILSESTEECAYVSHIKDAPVFKKNPSSYENQEARLLFFSEKGYMLSIETALASQVFINYHDQNMEPIEIKDALKSTLGSFYDGNYVLSDRKVINFNGEWQKEQSCELLGIDQNRIYAFNGDLLTLIDLTGKVISTIYVQEAYSFSIGKNGFAVICKSNIMLVKDVAEYIPASNIDFACFDGDRLIVRIEKSLFELQGRMLVKIFETEERPLTFFGGSLITLGENKLLPRPSLKFHTVRTEKIEHVSMDTKQFSKYNPYKN
ncbi:hypothetical protein GINT2_001815 [Glugoides intestinalis]